MKNGKPIKSKNWVDSKYMRNFFISSKRNTNQVLLHFRSFQDKSTIDQVKIEKTLNSKSSIMKGIKRKLNKSKMKENQEIAIIR